MVESANRAFRAEAGLQSLRSAIKALWWSGVGLTARRVTRPTSGEAGVQFSSDSPSPGRGRQARAWIDAFRKDIEDVRAGLYPATEPLFDDPAEALRAVSDFLRDSREVDARRRRGDGVEARYLAKSKAYPAYYRQNFQF